MRKQAGFTLIELIACIVILGLMGFGMSTVISLGTRSFFTARNADNAGVSAQIALERIALELRDIDSTAGAVRVLTSPTRIIYATSQTALPGTRTLAFSDGAITLAVDTGAGSTARTLLGGVSSCTMTFSGTGRSSSLTVTFTLTDAPTGEVFSITVKPRGNTATPVTV